MATEQLAIKAPDGKPLIEVREKEPSFMQLLQFAIEHKSAIDVIERLATLQENREAQRALNAFSEALDACKDEIAEVIPDLKNDTTGQMYPSYRALNRALKPIYRRHGLNPTFNTRESDKPEEIIVVCDLSHIGGHVKQYMIPMPTDGKGAKGGGVMSKSHATMAATSYGRSTLLRLIFDVVISDQQGEGMEEDELKERLAHFAKCRTVSEVFEHFKASFLAAEEIGDVKAQIELHEAKENRKKEIQDARAKR